MVLPRGGYSKIELNDSPRRNAETSPYMAKLATCPGCTTQLALPEEATLSDRARCPRCHEEFLLMETVQFSIPSAEILPPLEPGVESVADTLAAEESSVEPFERETARDGETVEETPGREELPVSATLSDWEARLKRAIAADVDDEGSHTKASPIFSEAASTKAEPAPELEDFAVADADLIPESSYPPSPPGEEWSPEEAYAPAEEPTVKFTTDQTITNVVRDEEEAPIEAGPISVRTDSVTPKKRKRSALRTLASAGLGVVGIPLGLYVLLWLRGPEGDVLHVAEYIPSFMLPASFAEIDDRDIPTQLAEQLEPDDTAESTGALTTNESDAEFDGTSELGNAEPLLRDDPAVARASAEEPVYRGPTFARVNPTEFAELLAAAEQEAPQLATGDLSSKASVAQMGQAYMALARLADKSAYLNQPGLTPEETTKALLAKQLFESTLREATVARDLPQIALRWWQFDKRPSPGIVLLGRVERLQTTDAGTIAFVSLGTEQIAPPLPVLIGNASHAPGELVGVVGSIMIDPQTELPALDASLGPVVIAHHAFALTVPLSERQTN